jgi:hypothetical protein
MHRIADTETPLNVGQYEAERADKLALYRCELQQQIVEEREDQATAELQQKEVDRLEAQCATLAYESEVEQRHTQARAATAAEKRQLQACLEKREKDKVRLSDSRIARKATTARPR